MILLGLTGSIGMGKSTTAQMFRDEGVPVHDADAAVHDLYDVGGAAVAPVGEAFPGVVVDGRVDRVRLGERVLGNPEALRRLESIVHPLVGGHRDAFLKQAQAAGAPVAVLEVQLLFETGGEKLVDKVAVVTAPADVQRQRVLARPGMTPAKLDAILARQTPDAEKRARADYIIDTSEGLDAARDQVRAILAQLGVAGPRDA